MDNEALDNLVDNISTNEGDITPLSDREIFTKIWTSPRMVFKYINATEYNKFMYVLLIIYGIHSSLDRAIEKNLGNSMSFMATLAIAIVAGGLFGWIFCYLYSALLSWTGGWLGGKGNTNSILRTFAYATIPSAVALVLIVPQILMYGENIFRLNGDFAIGSSFSIVFFYIVAAAEFILGVWTLVLSVIGLSEVQKFSIGRSIGNMLLAALTVVVPIVLLAFLFAKLR